MATPSIVLPGFCSGTYQARSPLSQAEECINLFPESDGSGTGRATLYAVPGLKLYCTLPTVPLQGELETNYRTFVVSGGVFYEVFDDKTFQAWGNVGAGVVSMATNGSPAVTVNDTTGGQIVIVANHKGYVFDLATNTLSPITDPGFPLQATNVTVIDGYFVVGNFKSREFNISNLDDGTTWTDSSGLPMFATKEGNSDNLQAVYATRRTLVVFGFETTEVWWDSGAIFPLQPIQGALLQQGLAAVHSPCVMDDQIFWLGSDERGNAQVWGQQNLAPIRISNYAIETLLQNCQSIDDAVGEVYQEDGHVHYLLHLPSANYTSPDGTFWDSITICFDNTTGQWHKRGSWDVARGVYHAAAARFHIFAFVPAEHRDPAPGVVTDGLHLVGDWRNGNLYVQDMSYYDDNGAPKRWLRRAPNLINQNQRNAFYRLEIFCGVGVVPLPPAPGSNPIMGMRYSDDGGYTWSNDKYAYMGLTGRYKNRVIWRQLGSGRDRVFEVYGDDPVAISLVECYVRLVPGNG